MPEVTARELANRVRLQEALDRLKEQEEWISECGGSLAGYIAKYGSRKDPDHSGNGGEAIYEADISALAVYMEQVADLQP